MVNCLKHKYTEICKILDAFFTVRNYTEFLFLCKNQSFSLNLLISMHWKYCRVLNIPEMEYRASAASMLVEEIWHIVEGFVEVPANL